MHSSIKSLLASLVVVSSIAFAQPEGEVVVRTRDGKTHQGRVLSETQKGYLFAGARGTSIIEFANIVDLQKVDAQVPVAHMVVAEPIVPPPPPAPIVASPPPPPTRPVDEVIHDSPVPVATSREGFHFGMGANVGVGSYGATGFAQVHFDFNFGRPTYRISANFGAFGSLFNASVDNLFHFNIGQVYTLGAGVQLGVAFGGGYSFAYAAAVIQPVIVKLGERGQHQISLTGRIVALSTVDRHSWEEASIAGSLQVTAGYSFFF